VLVWLSFGSLPIVCSVGLLVDRAWQLAVQLGLELGWLGEFRFLVFLSTGLLLVQVFHVVRWIGS